MHIQELVDNVKGKNDVGFVVWLFSCWSLVGILLFIPFWIFMYVIVVLPMALIFEPKNTMVSLVDYIKNKLGIEVNANKKTIINNHIASQENQKQQSKTQKKTPESHTASNEYETDDEIESDGNDVLYHLLWSLWGIGAISHYFIKDTYKFSGNTFLFIWIIGFVIAVTAVILKREKFFSLVHIGFVLIVPFSFVFWLSVLYGLKEPNTIANIQPSNNPTINQAKHQSTLANDEINQILDNAVAVVKPTLPVQVDASTKLVDVKADKAMRKLQYIMQANLNSGELSLSEEDFQKIKNSAFLGEAKDEFCLESETKLALQNGIELDYLYYTKDGNYMGKVNINRQDCGY